MKVRSLSFSLLLPLVALVVWASLVPVPASVCCVRILHASHGADPVHLQLGIPFDTVASGNSFDYIVPRNQLFPYCVRSEAEAHASTWAINAPGLLVNFLIGVLVLFVSGQHLPAWLPFLTAAPGWQELFIPFYALPAWWFVGRSLDALTGRKSLARKSRVIGILLSLCCLSAAAAVFVLFSHITIMGQPLDGTAPAVVFVLWTLAFAIAPLAWWRQCRKSRAAAANTNGAA